MKRKRVSLMDSRGLDGLYLLGICHVLAPLRERERARERSGERERERESLLVYSITGVSR